MRVTIKALALALVPVMTLAVTICAGLSCMVFADMTGENGKTIPAATVNIHAEHVISGDDYDRDDEFKFVLAARDEKCPMPPGSSEGLKTITVKGAEDLDFGDIVFEYPGEYTYAISRVEGSYSDLDVDDEIYSILVAKFNDGSVEMVMWNGSGEKVDEIVYTDHYDAPEPPARKSPKTGDEEKRMQIILYSSMGLAAFAGLVLILIGTRTGKGTAGREKGGCS